MHKLTESEIDEAFAQMAHDSDYHRESIAMAKAFEQSDWEALKSAQSAMT